MDVETAHVPEISGRFQSLAERRRARRERTVGGSDPLWNLGKLLTRLRNGKTLAQRIAEGEELNGETIGLDFPLDPEFVLSLATIEDWGCPFCYSAHGTSVGVSQYVSARNL